MLSKNSCKIFIGGFKKDLEWETLKDYLNKYGELKEVRIIKDFKTQISKGYGFATFVDQSSVDKVIDTESHWLEGNKLTIKMAIPKRRQADLAKTKLVFIRGISTQTKFEEIINYFEQFGQIDKFSFMITKRHSVNGFITFHRNIEADRACMNKYHEIKFRKVECEKVFREEVLQLFNKAKEHERISLEEESNKEDILEQVEVEEEVAFGQKNLEQEAFEQESLAQLYPQPPNYVAQPANILPVAYAPQPVPQQIHSAYSNFAPPMVPVLPHPTTIHPIVQPFGFTSSQYQHWNVTNVSYQTFYQGQW